MKLPRKLKKKLIAKFGREMVRKIVSDEVIYKAKITAKMTESGWITYYGGKTIFREIR
jgi:hypothetical protein